MLPLGMVGGIVAVLVGAVLLVTAVTRTCPAYSVLGMDTLRR
jgi:hypothetical protein